MKAAGALILSVIPVVLFYRWGEELRLKEKQRKAFFKLLVHIRFQIENFSRDQKEIFKRFSDPVLERTDFFTALEKELENIADKILANEPKTEYIGTIYTDVLDDER